MSASTTRHQQLLVRTRKELSYVIKELQHQVKLIDEGCDSVYLPTESLVHIITLSGQVEESRNTLKEKRN